ncbi:C69 family dipeptidase [Collinsella sp. zg1085]|uniref:C69 family dipeptidase n=1 Tax=Collinsella sp. zg1085 TaxID=2844380 RepID=UPI001C0DA14A|nr:C69 family dipeptidase [Collinsella sp. zg1085]QWT17388.1 C69 family dipeptidase [Collinsella sp. zg1085]
MLAASLIMAAPLNALACTQVYVGSDLTANGSTYVGRAEDWKPRYVKGFGIQERMENKVFRSFENGDTVEGFEYTLPGTSYRYTYLRDLPSEWDAEDDEAASRVYSEAGINEKGVAVSGTLTLDYNERAKAADPNVATGIGEYNMGDYVLSVADNARDGVRKLGKIIDEHGSFDQNMVIIADANETWLFSQVSGHQWFAIKMASDVVSVNPNIGRLQYKVNLDDENACIHSENLVKLAQEHGFLVKYEDDTPNIFASYGLEDPGSAQWTRYVQGHAYFGDVLKEGTDYTVSANGEVSSVANPQLTFKPSGDKIDTFKALRALCARGEQTPNLNANLNAYLYAIGNNRTTEAHLFEIRKGQPQDIAIVQWQALSRCEFSVYFPIYSALLTEVPEEYFPAWNTIDSAHMGDDDSVTEAMKDEPGKILDYVFMDINTLAYNNRGTVAEGARAYLDAVQRSIIAQHNVVDGIMKNTAPEKRSALANRLFDEATEALYAKAKGLLNEIRAYINAGDFSQKFKASDLGEDGMLRTPLNYAGHFVEPSFTMQPASANYKLGDAAQPLMAHAVVLEGVEGADSTVRYQWYEVGAAENTGERAANNNDRAIAGSMSAMLPIDTSMAGTRSYYVVATSATGLTAVSETATVTVSEKEAIETPNPEKEPGVTPKKKVVDEKKPGNMSHKTMPNKAKTMLPKTGDFVAGAVSIVAALGVVAAGSGVVMNRRKKR